MSRYRRLTMSEQQFRVELNPSRFSLEASHAILGIQMGIFACGMFDRTNNFAVIRSQVLDGDPERSQHVVPTSVDVAVEELVTHTQAFGERKYDFQIGACFSPRR